MFILSSYLGEAIRCEECGGRVTSDGHTSGGMVLKCDAAGHKFVMKTSDVFMAIAEYFREREDAQEAGSNEQ